MAKKTITNKQAMISGFFIAMGDETFTKGKMVSISRSCGVYKTENDLISVINGKPIEINGRNVVKIHVPHDAIIHHKEKTFGVKNQEVKVLSVEPLEKVLQKAMTLEEVA